MGAINSATSVSFSMPKNGKKVKVESQNNGTFVIVYDKKGREIQRTKYDNKSGEVLATESTKYKRKTVKTTTTGPDGSSEISVWKKGKKTSNIQYDAEGNKICEEKIKYGKDGSETGTTRLQDGRKIVFNRDAEGHDYMETEYDKNGNITSFEYKT